MPRPRKQRSPTPDREEEAKQKALGFTPEQRVHHIVIHHLEGAAHDHHPTDPGPARDPGLRHQHTSGKIDWFPDNIKGGARKKVLDGLFNRA
jgi:uncharacterized protein YukJ